LLAASAGTGRFAGADRPRGNDENRVSRVAGLAMASKPSVDFAGNVMIAPNIALIEIQSLLAVNFAAATKALRTGDINWSGGGALMSNVIQFKSRAHMIDHERSVFRKLVNGESVECVNLARLRQHTAQNIFLSRKNQARLSTESMTRLMTRPRC
jgi:hypothetical protein